VSFKLIQNYWDERIERKVFHKQFKKRSQKKDYFETFNSQFPYPIIILSNKEEKVEYANKEAVTMIQKHYEKSLMGEFATALMNEKTLKNTNLAKKKIGSASNIEKSEEIQKNFVLQKKCGSLITISKMRNVVEFSDLEIFSKFQNKGVLSRRPSSKGSNLSLDSPNSFPKPSPKKENESLGFILREKLKSANLSQLDLGSIKLNVYKMGEFGRYEYFTVNISKVVYKNQTCTLLVFTDISQLIQEESLQKSMEIKKFHDDIMETVCHNFRTPLFQLQILMEELKSKMPPGKDLENMERALRTKDILLLIVEDLLDYSKLIVEKFDLEMG